MSNNKCNDSNNNAAENGPVTEDALPSAEEVKSSIRRVTRSSSATPKVPPRRVRLTITSLNNSTKTQGDELNEIKATRRRHTRSYNLDNS